MSQEAPSYFRAPRDRDRYWRWTSPGYDGWIDVSLHEHMNAELLEEPEKLFELSEGRVARDRRNLTLHARIGDRGVWIKRFKTRSALDWIMYAPRAGKAAYAWNAAMALTDNGFYTPRPLAGLRRTGSTGGAAGIVVFEDVDDHAPLEDWLSEAPPEPVDCEALLSALGECLRRFHDLGFRHRDLRRGNVLARHNGGEWSFCFLDLNRLRVQAPLTVLQRLREVERLNLPARGLGAFFRSYMPDRDDKTMAGMYRDRVTYADRLERRPLGRLLRKAWYYSWELRAFTRARRP